MKATVLNVKLYRRKGLRFWQAKVTFGDYSKRVSTRTVHRSAAAEFAELAYRHYSRLARAGNFESFKQMKNRKKQDNEQT